MNAPALPQTLKDNPRLDRWVRFEQPGKATVSTGKVEIGQGVLTAMLQIAAEELDVAPSRILLRSGDTEVTPNEGYTSGSLSIQIGGVALRAACAEVKQIFLDHAAAKLGADARTLSVRDGAIFRNGEPTGLDYWSLANEVDLTQSASGRGRTKSITDYALVGQSAERIDLADKVFGRATYIHDMTLPGMRHARVIRQPNRGAAIETIDEDAIRRAARGPVDIVRRGDFVAIVGEAETAVELAAGAAPDRVRWSGVEPVAAFQEEARWLLQRPSIDRVLGAPEPDEPARGVNRHEATYSRGYVAHASLGPSCGLAQFKDGRLEVWTHSQGVFPLRMALARTLKLPTDAITVKHVQGPGCYGHNGADDAAADAAVIAFLMPGVPIRVRWRREEEFGFEPVSSAMVVTVRAELDDAGRPADWTTEVWSGTHSTRPGRDGQLLAEIALPDAGPPPPPHDVPDAGGGGGTRNAEPLYDFAAKRIVHHLIPETPVRLSALRGLGATANVFALESFIDELAEKAGEDPVAFRLDMMKDPRARAVIEHVARMSDWDPEAEGGTGRGRGIGFARYKNRAAYAAIVVELEVEEEIRLINVWCASDAGLIINPDGAINQLEGGIVQAASWVLKEQVRLEGTGVSSRDWDTYPILRFTEVPDVMVELVGAKSDNPALGIGEACGGPMAAAIGNAVAHALGARLRNLPLTRERIMAALLEE